MIEHEAPFWAGGVSDLDAAVRPFWEYDRPRKTSLTGRELEVMRLVAQGRTNLEIGARLDITESTAKAHLRKIMLRLGAVNRAQAVYLWARSLEDQERPAGS